MDIFSHIISKKIHVAPLYYFRIPERKWVNVVFLESSLVSVKESLADILHKTVNVPTFRYFGKT